jgi:peptidoglycan/xylan/chitin deacetylase (PgdA/CDA1 family)
MSTFIKPLVPILITIVIALGVKLFYPQINTSIPTETNTIITPTATASPSATPTPKPLTFSEMNQKYGPCIKLPVLMYHHVQDWDVASSKKQTSLTVSTSTFEAHLNYLAQKGYNPISPGQLINFFNNNSPLPSKPLLITFDDAYQDNYTDAFPLLKRAGYPAIVFTPTGLIGNPDYLTWDQVKLMSESNLITFGNHTWSHKSAATDLDTIKKEINTARTQLQEKKLNKEAIFAYPYGTVSSQAQNYLRESNFQLAFTTQSGSVQCSKQRLSLPRIRIGNSTLSAFGI